MSTGMVTMLDAAPDLYDELVAAGCETDSYESCLYVQDSPKARELVQKHGKRLLLFVDQIDRQLWIEVPFEYSPFWRHKERLAQARREAGR